MNEAPFAPSAAGKTYLALLRYDGLATDGTIACAAVTVLSVPPKAKSICQGEVLKIR